MTLAILAPYRRRNIASSLLQSVLDAVTGDEPKVPGIESIYLHVQTNNDSAIKFYDGFGIKIDQKIEGYYKRIDPPDCYVLLKSFGAAETSNE